MPYKRIGAMLCACVLILGCNAIPASAADMPADNTIILRATGQFNHSIPANSIIAVDPKISMGAGETVTFDCTYTPKSASLDFGVIDSSGVFHYINRTNGSINQAIEITKNGQYTLAIRNNASYAVTVTGTVKY